MPAVIEAEGVSFSYSGVQILHDISFTIDKGECVALIGANGAGKSTLMRILLGELPCRDGRVRLFGEEAGAFRGWRRIGYVPQNGAGAVSGFPATVGELVAANLYEGFLRYPGKSLRPRVEEALRAVGIQEQARQLVGRLSGGQLQRALIARALVRGPELLLLDEPESGVDAESAGALYALLSDLQKQGVTILMVTHDTGRAVEMIDRALCLEYGTLVQLGREDLLHELSHRHIHPRRQE